MRFFYELRREPTAFAGLSIVIMFLAFALFAKWIAPHDPLEINLKDSQIPPAWVEGGSTEHLLGTDRLGRDLASRIIYGSRTSMLVAALGILGSCTIGVFLGLIAGYFGGRLDSLIMRVVDIQLGIPFILLAIFIVAVLGPSLRNVVLIFAIIEYPFFARITRGEVLRIKNKEFVDSAIAIGARSGRIIFKHVLPNILDTVFVSATLEVGLLILYESALGFLGLGVAPPAPTWGNLLAEGSELLKTSWWVATFPGISIMLLVLGVNLVGDWTASMLDPIARSR